jgi:hypothetical protein
LGPLISRVRVQACDLTVHVRSPLPSHLQLPGSSRLASAVLTLGRRDVWGEEEVLARHTLFPCSGCFLHSVESASTPLGFASPLAPVGLVHAPPLSGALTGSSGASFPTRGGSCDPSPLASIPLTFLSVGVGSLACVFSRALARPRTAYGSGDGRRSPLANCFVHPRALTVPFGRAERATDPHRRCR